MNPIRQIEKEYQVIVIGGGMSGVCAAIASARNGAKTALIQNRSVLGGNASSEIRMHILGANCRNTKDNMIEGGVLMEILLENKRRNPYHTYPVWDTIIWEKVRFQDGLDLYLNTNLEGAETEGDTITAIECFQNTTETRFTFRGDIFIDATGHGTLGALSGAAYRGGSETKDEFGEPSGKDEYTEDAMGNTLMFQAIDRGQPVTFIKPDWAHRFTEENLRHRVHANADTMLHRKENAGNSKDMPEYYNVDSGYWWIEVCAKYHEIISKGEEIRDELAKCVYGVWDHIKNVSDHGAANLDLDWIGFVPGYRESRRLEGDYFLKEQDVLENRIFEDAVAYGGWPLNDHIGHGILDFDQPPSKIRSFEGCYTIPYRCFYSRNVKNLMMAGRDISVSKVAYGTTRVMATCAVGGQAAGTAAAIAIKHGVMPREVAAHMDELQQTLLKDDCYIPGYASHDEKDIARAAKASASSCAPGCDAANVINGVSRNEKENINVWESAPLNGGEAWIRLDLDAPKPVHQVRLTFDPNLSREFMPSITKSVRDRQCKGMPDELVKDYMLTLKNGDDTVFEKKVSGNYQRLNIIDLPEGVEADSLTVTVSATHDHPAARIFEIRMY